MAEMAIRLLTDPAVGKKDIIVSLRSDEDTLPHEHEQQHRALVEKLIEGGAMAASEVGKVILQHEEETEIAQVVPYDEQQHRHWQSDGH